MCFDNTLAPAAERKHSRTIWKPSDRRRRR